MKTTSISTQALLNATREMRLNMQVRLTALQKEATTGRHADMGLALGYMTQRTVSLRQDIDRLTTFKDTNKVASARLELSQVTLEGMAQSAQGFLTTLTAARSSRSADGTAITDAKNKMTSFMSSLNTAVNGAYIFAGVNTDVKPIDDYFGTPTSAARTAMANAFTTEFGIAQSAPGVENITPADMKTFLDGAFSNLFDNANWSGTWSAASDQNITSRISTNERIETSANANAAPFRAFASALTMISDIGLEQLNDETYLAVVDKAMEVVGQALFDITQLRAGLGTSGERIKAANESIDIQVSLITGHVGNIENVDAYEATAQAKALLVQIETAYALTASLQKLSLINHI